ncbi:DEAD/DEAH box helicase [Stutzerimonas tarimensis]|uniref:DEAD/DEAH box helicase n=1 Tax=Stutzerimonas tarimensis TaxID=1507735 RepID=A0ABV7T065_9GAMM
MPLPMLSLGSHAGLNYQPGSGRMVPALQHRAGLSFAYLDARTHDKARPNERLSVKDGESRLSIVRQTRVEQAYRQRLLELGFSPALRQSQALPKDSGEMFDLPSEPAWLRFATEHLALLRQEGWRIEIQSGFAFDLHSVQHWYAQVDELPGQRHFELDLGLVVDNERISLVPVLLRLIRSSHPGLADHKRLALRADHELMRLTLEARTPFNVALPLGRLKPILALLADTCLHQSDDRLRLDRSDASRLLDLEGSTLQWQGGDALLQFARSLRDYDRCATGQPMGLQATLRGYQLQGLRWMQTLGGLRVGGILADDMGLGKTLQSLAHLLSEKQAGRLTLPSLVVMPTSLIPNWLDEAARFAPELRVRSLHGSKRAHDLNALRDFDLLLTTYPLLSRDIDTLEQLPLHLVILDEAQNIKNATSKAAQAARRLQARQRFCLTGTPLENHLGELWSLFHFLMPGWLGDAKAFNRDYRFPIEKHGDQARLQQLQTRIQPFLLRRKKEDVARELPPKIEIIQWVELSPAQRDAYESIRLTMDRKVRREIERHGLASSQLVILEALLKLRQVCCDLRLVKKLERPSRGSAKLDCLLTILDEQLAEGRRILLFSQFTSMLALIEGELKSRKIDYVQITGKTVDRRTPVERFQRGQVALFLISLKAGGTGLNLTAADTVIHFDPWWNPAAEDQATDRAYRIGQDKPVLVYKLIARGTVEEKIQQLQRRKATLASDLLEQDGERVCDLQQSEIEALFAPLADPAR